MTERISKDMIIADMLKIDAGIAAIPVSYTHLDFVITFHIHLPHFRNCHTTNKIPVFIFGCILMSIHESNDDRLPLSFCSLSPLQVCHH